MVVQWEDKFYEGNRGHTYLGDPENRKQIYPDYVAMAKSFNVPCERVMFKKDLRAAMQRMLDSDQPYLARRDRALHRTRAAVHSGRQDGGGHDLEAITGCQESTGQTLVARPSFCYAQEDMRTYILWLAMVTFAGPLVAAERKFDFSETPLNQPPPHCFNTVAGTGKPGTWKVIMDEVPLALPPLSPGAASTAKQSVVAQLAWDATDEHFPMLILGDESYNDFTFNTRFKIVDGLTEQMAGIAFRVQDEKNFYVIRASVLSGTFYFYKVEKGVRFKSYGNNIKIEKGVWHDLSLECKGTTFHILLDGKQAMPMINDPTFTTGKIAFWTKSDSISYFTDTRITYTPREPFVQALVRDTLKLYPRLLGSEGFHGATQIFRNALRCERRRKGNWPAGGKGCNGCHQPGDPLLRQRKRNCLSDPAFARSKRRLCGCRAGRDEENAGTDGGECRLSRDAHRQENAGTCLSR